MNKLIYLDQNILSDLRSRKLKETADNYFVLFKNFLLKFNIQVVYSHITLAEINQISNDEYKKEHLDVLEELNAKYIEPKNKKISDKKPSQIWIDYVEYLNIENDILGFKNLALTLDNLSRKSSGLPNNNSFEKIGESLEDSIKNLSNKIINLLDIDIDESNLKEEYKGNISQIKSYMEQMKKDLPILLNKRLESINKLAKFDSIPLGPKPFREYEPIKSLNISELPSCEVVLAIEKICNKNNEFNWRDSFEDSIENGISMAYTLMNWAGYYPDDFDKIKKNTDRFRASNNDMQHAILASNTSFLISNDYAFCMKAIASYEYSGVNTIVCSVETFLEKYYELEK